MPVEVALLHNSQLYLLRLEARELCYFTELSTPWIIMAKKAWLMQLGIPSHCYSFQKKKIFLSLGQHSMLTFDSAKLFKRAVPVYGDVTIATITLTRTYTKHTTTHCIPHPCSHTQTHLPTTILGWPLPSPPSLPPPTLLPGLRPDPSPLYFHLLFFFLFTIVQPQKYNKSLFSCGGDL